MVDAKPAIVPVLGKEGIELRQRGRDYWALCPFHNEKTPSFKVNTDRQTFHCFGCGAHGDVIDFIQKLHDLDFKEALRYLGIEGGKPGQIDRVAQKKRELIRKFRTWEKERRDELSDEYRLITHALCECKTMDEVITFAELIHKLPAIEHEMNTLFNGNDEEKYDLYRHEF